MSHNRTSPLGLLIAGICVASGAWLAQRDGTVHVAQAHGKYGQRTALLTLERPVAAALGLGMLVIGLGIAALSIRMPHDGDQTP